MSDRETILHLVSEGKITPEEGAQLIQALGESEAPARRGPAERPVPGPARAGKGRFLRMIVKVSPEEGDANPDKSVDVDVNVPISLANRLAPMLENVIPPEAQRNMDEKGFDIGTIAALLSTLDEDMEGRDLVNVTVGKGMTEGQGEVRVRIYVE